MKQCFWGSSVVVSCSGGQLHDLLILGWPKSSFEFFHTILQKNPNELFGQLNNVCVFLNVMFQYKFFLRILLNLYNSKKCSHRSSDPLNQEHHISEQLFHL